MNSTQMVSYPEKIPYGNEESMMKKTARLEQRLQELQSRQEIQQENSSTDRKEYQSVEMLR